MRIDAIFFQLYGCFGFIFGVLKIAVLKIDLSQLDVWLSVVWVKSDYFFEQVYCLWITVLRKSLGFQEFEHRLLFFVA